MTEELDLADFSLEQVSIDYGIECRLQSSNRWIAIHFSSAKLADGQIVDVSRPSSIEALLNLLHVHATKCWVGEGSVLNLAFQQESVVSFHPRDDVESWELVTSENQRWVCMPGGEIAVWKATG